MRVFLYYWLLDAYRFVSTQGMTPVIWYYDVIDGLSFDITNLFMIMYISFRNTSLQNSK